MNPCERLRPLLYRVAEGEASPDEAMHAARHLSDCTTCRIVLAREQRLAEILEDDLEDRLPVGEEFVQAVMANLPSETPPRPRRKKRRSLKLAGLAGLLGMMPLLATRATGWSGASLVSPSLPRLDTPGLEGAVGTVVAVGRLVAAAVSAVATELPGLSGVFSPTGGFGALLALPFVIALVGAAALLALASPALLRVR